MTKHHKKLVLIDAHAVIHRAYHALPDFVSAKGEPTGALYGLASILLKLLADLKPDYVVAAYDLPGPTFRKQLYDAYKAGRVKAEDDLIKQLQRSRAIFSAFHIPIYDAPGFEADDIIGTIVEQVKTDSRLEVIIATGDTDTFQLVSGQRVRVLIPKRGISETVLYDEGAVEDRYGFKPPLLPDYKGLAGDPSDNIIGVKGVGEKTATTLIKAFGPLESLFKQLKKDSTKVLATGVTPRIIKILLENEEEAMFSKTLGLIRRDAPINFTLPRQTWSKSFSKEPSVELFEELGFRSLVSRLPTQAGVTGSPTPAPKTESLPKHLALMVWLLDSELADPSWGDVKRLVGETNFEEKLLTKLQEVDLLKIYSEIESPLTPVLEAATTHGLLVDIKHLRVLSNTYHQELAILTTKIYKLVGKEFNLNSPKQLATVLFDDLALGRSGLKKTPGGLRSTKESELTKLRDAHPAVGFILEYRELQKIISTYVDNLLLLVDQHQRLHTTFKQTGSATGRLSSTQPNLQNIPIAGSRSHDLRQAFIAPPGYRLVSFDYSQIEIRVLAWLSGDPALLEIFKRGEDVHTAVAARVFGVAPEAVTKDMRRQAKVINFGIIYGMGVNALKANLGGSRQEAVEFYGHYFETFPTVRAYLEQVKTEARTKGYTNTWFGRRRYFPGLKSPIPYIRAMNERMATNAPLQGTAADIVKLAMVAVDKLLTERELKNQIHLILQIHDELIYEVAESVGEEILSLIKTTMEDVVKTEAPIPFTVNHTSGPTWADL